MNSTHASSAIVALSQEPAEHELALLVAMAADRGSTWTRDDLAGLLERGIVLLATVDEAAAAVFGMLPHDDREDAAQVALLWETRPYDHALMDALANEAAEQCRAQGVSVICVEVPEAQREDVELFTGLGFAIIEHVEGREPTARERREWGLREARIDGHTALEMAL